MTKGSICHRVVSLGDRCFLTHIVQIDYVIVVPYFKYQVCMMSGTPSMAPLLPTPGRIFGLQVVPDTLSGDRLCHSGAMFKVSGL